MKNIEFSVSFEVNGKPVTSIEVHPVSFVKINEIWEKASADKDNPSVALQRGRIVAQTKFKAGDEVLNLTSADLQKLPSSVAKLIIAELDTGAGEKGEIAITGNGSTTPIVYRLGTPFTMKGGDKEIVISELEFLASTYGEVEEILATQEEMTKTLKLIRTVGKPVGTSLMRLPESLIDRITISDGLQIMRKVLPSF